MSFIVALRVENDFDAIALLLDTLALNENGDKRVRVLDAWREDELISA